jgi:hypothetical protein
MLDDITGFAESTLDQKSYVLANKLKIEKSDVVEALLRE